MIGTKIVTTKTTRTVDSTYRIQPGTILTVVRTLPRNLIVGETHTGRWVILSQNQYRTV